MREIRLSGSVRGVRRKPYPYRDTIHPVRSSVEMPVTKTMAGAANSFASGDTKTAEQTVFPDASGLPNLPRTSLKPTKASNRWPRQALQVCEKPHQ